MIDTLHVTFDRDVDSHEAARAIEAGMPIEQVEMLMAPIAIEPITDEEPEFLATLTQEQTMRLREIKAERAFDRRFGLA